MSTDYDAGQAIPDDATYYTDDEGYQLAEIDGETYVLAEDGNYHHISAFADTEPDTEPDADAEMREWYQAKRDEELRADERARIEAEHDEEEAPLVGWLRERPHLLADFENFELAVDKADGDLDRGQQYYEAALAEHTDDLDRAARHENVNQARTYDEAFEQWDTERAAVKPYKHDAVRPGDSMQDAMNSFVDDLHERNETDRRSRELVREQERRGR